MQSSLYWCFFNHPSTDESAPPPPPIATLDCGQYRFFLIGWQYSLVEKHSSRYRVLEDGEDFFPRWEISQHDADMLFLL